MPRMMPPSRKPAALAIVVLLAGPALAWDAHGHRAITTVALESFEKAEGAPPWLKDEGVNARIADESTVPDRWRSAKVAQLKHLNDPDHYIDIEDLADYGLSIESVPQLRYEYVKALTLAREHLGADFKGRPINPATDTAKTQEWPGFLPHAILEQYGKVQSAFRVVRSIEAQNDPARKDQLEMARADAMVQMGILAHFVGDAAQPLHTTRYHHGWVGDNPQHFSTDRKIHAFIDGEVLRIHHLDAAAIRDAANPSTPPRLDANDPWAQVIAYITRSHQRVTPLYELEKSGAMRREEGGKFIAERLADAASMLAALYQAAWESSAPNQKDLRDFTTYDNFDRTPPAEQPSPAAPK